MYGISKMAAKFENFSLCKMKIRAILRRNNCLEAIGERSAKITNDK